MTSPQIDNPELVMPWFVPDLVSWRRYRSIKASEYFLMDLTGLGELPKCGRCGGRHRYLTTMCRERPFSGLTEGLMAYYRSASVHTSSGGGLSSTERSRLREIERQFVNGVPDISTSHTSLARITATPDGDMDVGAIAVGVAHPLTAQEAKYYLDRINAVLPIRARLRLPGLEGVQRAVQVSGTVRLFGVPGGQRQGVRPRLYDPRNH